MKITIDTERPLSGLEARILTLLLEEPPAAQDPWTGLGAPAPAEKPQETPPEPQETTSGPDQALLDEAIRRATKSIKADGGDQVKALLARMGKEKVTQLDTDESLRTFIDGLGDDQS
jgi:hypothetical protein